MSENFGLKIGLDGEKKFKKSLAEINNSFKVLGSEMKPLDYQFDKNDKSTEALTAHSEVLNKEIDQQKQKIETLRSALANAAESFGENGRRTQSRQIQLNNAQAALNDIDRKLSSNSTATEKAAKGIDYFQFIGGIYSQYANKCCEFFQPKASSYAYHIQTLQTLSLSACKPS